MLEPSGCGGPGCNPFLESLGMFFFSPVIAVNAFMEALMIGVGLAVVAGAVYALVVFGSGGHLGGWWTRDSRVPSSWRVRWLTLANSGYLLGMATLAALSVPAPAILALIAAALFSSLIALNVVTERPSTSVGLEWMPLGGMALFIAFSARLVAQAPAQAVGVAASYALGALLSALEVPALARRTRTVHSNGGAAIEETAAIGRGGPTPSGATRRSSP